MSLLTAGSDGCEREFCAKRRAVSLCLLGIAGVGVARKSGAVSVGDKDGPQTPLVLLVAIKGWGVITEGTVSVDQFIVPD
jgi:hypothetical protein